MHKPEIRKYLGLLWLAIAILVAAGIVLSIERSSELDLRSGRTRTRCTIAGWSVWESVADTGFSALAREYAEPAAPAMWRRVDSWSALEPVSPYYRFHTVPDALDEFTFACRAGSVKAADRARLVNEVLRCLADEDLEGINRATAVTPVDQKGDRGEDKGAERRIKVSEKRRSKPARSSG